MNLRDKILMKQYVPYIISTALLIGLSFLAPEKALSQTVPDGTSPTVTGITSGRAWAIGGAVIALLSVVIGWRAKARSKANNLSGAGNKSTQAIIALVLGAIAIILSVIHLSTSAGAVFGSGSGKAGAIVALVIALIGTTLSGLALRPKRQ